MDINVYNKIYNSLVEFNNSISSENYGNEIKQLAPNKPKYPLTVFEEIANAPKRGVDTPIDRVSTMSYRVEIFAQDKGNIPRRDIARNLAQKIDNFLYTRYGLRRLSYNAFPREKGNSLYQVTLIYTNSYFENRQLFY